MLPIFRPSQSWSNAHYAWHADMRQYNIPQASMDSTSPTIPPHNNLNMGMTSQDMSSRFPTTGEVPASMDRWLHAASDKQNGKEYLPGGVERYGPVPDNVGLIPGNFREPLKSDTSSVVTGYKDSGYGTRPATFSTASEEPSRTGLEVPTLEQTLDQVGVRSQQPPASHLAVSETGQTSSSRASGKNRSNEETCPHCGEKPRLASELKKHLLKHRKPFCCDVPSCEKSRPGHGFTTTNDLDRHKASKHHIFSPDAKIYKCAAEPCVGKSKKWSRLDNFRQHVDRTHPNENKEELVKRSQCDPDPHAPSKIPMSDTAGEPDATVFPQMPYSSIPDNDQQHEKAHSQAPYFPQQENSLWPTDTSHNSHLPFTGLGGAGAGAAGAAASSVEYNPSPTQPHLTSVPSEQPTPTSEVRHWQSKHDQSQRERSTSGASTRKPMIKFPQARTDSVQSRSTCGPKSEVIIHHQHSPHIVSEIARIYGKEDDEIAKRKVSELLQTNVELFHHTPLTKRRALGRDAMQDLQPNCNSGVLSSDELADYRYQHSRNNDESPKSEPLSPTHELSRHMHDQHQNGNGHSSDSPSHTDASSSPAVFKCSRPSCSNRDPYSTKNAWEKHAQRHERRFGCTTDSCHKKFGSKNDWKRHENSQHFQVDIWQCEEPAKGGDEAHGQKCQKLYYRKEVFASHLRKAHEITEKPKIDKLCKSRRIGVGGQESFWCGFCSKIIKLENKNTRAWDERFDHIGNHFTKENCKIEDWITSGGKKTKRQVREEMQKEFKPPVEIEAETSGDEEDNEEEMRDVGSLLQTSKAVDHSCLDPILLGYQPPDDSVHHHHHHHHHNHQNQHHQDLSQMAMDPRIMPFYCCRCNDGPYSIDGPNQMCIGISNPNSTSTCGHILCDECHRTQ